MIAANDNDEYTAENEIQARASVARVSPLPKLVTQPELLIMYSRWGNTSRTDRETHKSCSLSEEIVCSFISTQARAPSPDNHLGGGRGRGAQGRGGEVEKEVRGEKGRGKTGRGYREEGEGKGVRRGRWG